MLDAAARILDRPRWRWALIVGIAAGGLAYLAYWAGVPRQGMTAFVTGIILLVGASLGYGFGGWLLLFRASPGKAPAPRESLSPESRRLLAVLLGVGVLCLTVGGFWDEVWHRKYGLPFGQDLFWRPHLLIYFGLLLPPALAAVSLAVLLTRGKGTLRKRLRADRGLGWMALLGGFLLFNVPADPIWHTIYGADISAWSLPHLVLMTCAIMLALLGSFFLFSTTAPPGRWASVVALRPAFVLVFFTSAMSVMAQVLIGDFAPGNPMGPLRPVWLLPALLTIVALLMGTLAIHATRAYGAATAVGLLSVLIRFGLVAAFDFPQIRPGAWLPLLPLLLAIDLVYAFRIRSGQAPPSALGSGLATVPGAAVSIGLIHFFFDYTPRGTLEIGASLIACLVAGTAASWLGKLIGDSLAARTVARPVESGPRRMIWVAPVVFSASIVVIVYMIATAVPPGRFF